MTRPARDQGAPPGKLPWSLNDLTRLTSFLIVSGVVIVGCAAGAGQTSVYDHQLLWIVGASVALMLSGLGWTRWLLIGSRNLRVRQRRLDTLTARLSSKPEARVTTTGHRELRFAAAGMTRFHRATCPLTEGKDVAGAPRNEQIARGLAPCGVCAP